MTPEQGDSEELWAHSRLVVGMCFGEVLLIARVNGMTTNDYQSDLSRLPAQLGVRFARGNYSLQVG